MKRSQIRRSQAPTSRRFRPAVSALEDRLLLTAYTWDVTTGGNFNSPLNWADPQGNHGVPGPNDSATIGRGGITVTVSQSTKVNSINSYAGSPIEINAGTFSIENVNASSVIQSLDLASGATFEADGGATDINDSYGVLNVYAGTFDAAANATITFGSNPGEQQDAGQDLDAGTAFTGDGLIDMNANWTVNANVTAPENFEIDGDDLSIATGVFFTVPGTFKWTGGTLDGSGTMVIAPQGTLDLTGASNKVIQDNTTLTNKGTGTWDGTGQITSGGVGGTINNNGTLTAVQNDSVSGSIVFNNFGTFTKTFGNGVGVGLTTFNNYSFNNFGTVDCKDGTIDLNTSDNANKGSEDSGTFDAEAAATIEFTNAYTTLNAGTVLSGAGFFGIYNNTTTVEIDNAVSVKNLGLGDGGTIDGNATLTVTTYFTWSGGTFDSPGTTSITAGTTLEFDPLSANTSDTLEGGYTLNNAGTAIWIGQGDISGVYGENSGTINNTGSFVIGSNGTVQNVTLDNTGTITKQSSLGTTTLANYVLENAGVVNVNTGTIYSFNSQLLAGQYNVAANANLSLTEGVVTGIITAAAGSTVNLDGYESITAIVPTPVYINPGAALNGPGAYTISAVYFNTNVTIQNLNLAKWSLDGPANVTVTGTLDWTGGDFADTTGTLTIAAGASLDISGNNGVSFDGRTVNLAGQMIWTGTGSINFSGSPLNILPTGVFTIESDQLISGGGSINNHGTITKAYDASTGNGLGTTKIAVPFSNTGTVSVDSGTLNVTQGVTQVSGSQLTGGNWSVASGSTTPVVLNLVTALTTIGPGASVTLSGPGASFADLSGLSTIAGSFNLFAQDFIASGNLTSSGSIILGALGLLTVPGNYTQTTTGAIFDFIQNVANGQVVVGGTATLAGAFTALGTSTLQPPIETAFKVLTFAKRSGSFGAINGLTLAGGEVLSPAYNATNLTLTAVPTNVATNVTTQVTLTIGAFSVDTSTGIVTQTIVVKNASKSAITGPISLALDSLTHASLVNQSGTTQATSPSGSPYINLVLGTSGALAAGQSVSVLLVFYDPSLLGITYTARVLAGIGAR